jgi:hypothetical protein
MSVTENEQDFAAQSGYGVFNTADSERINDSSCRSNHEQIAKRLVEYHFGWNPTVSAGEDYGPRMLLLKELATKAAKVAAHRFTCRVSSIPLHQLLPDLLASGDAPVKGR